MIKKLLWDSEFFGYPIAQIDVSKIDDLLKLNSEFLKYKLIYIFSDNLLPKNDELYKEVDIKVKLIKGIDNINEYKMSQYIKEYSGFQDDKLNELSLESGVYSRFKKDTKFINNEYFKLYSKWIEDSISKKIADKIIVYEQEGKILGFVSLKLKETYSEIGLIAVDKNARGKGIGKELLNATFYFTKLMKLPTIKIITQFENKIALNLYSKLGFEIEEQKCIYHLWND